MPYRSIAAHDSSEVKKAMSHWSWGTFAAMADFQPIAGGTLEKKARSSPALRNALGLSTFRAPARAMISASLLTPLGLCAQKSILHSLGLG